MEVLQEIVPGLVNILLPIFHEELDSPTPVTTVSRTHAVTVRKAEKFQEPSAGKRDPPPTPHIWRPHPRLQPR